MSFINCNLNHI